MGHRLGWKLCFPGGLIPVFVGLVGWFTGYLYSLIRVPEGNWLFAWRFQEFQFADLVAADRPLAGMLLANVHGCWSNVHTVGVMLAGLAR